MASRMSFGEIKEVIKASLVVAGFSAFGTYLLPDLRSERLKEFLAKEFDSDAEKAIAAYRTARKGNAKGQN